MEGNEKTANDTSDNNGGLNYYPRDKGVRDAVDELVRAVFASEVYTRYEEANARLSAKPELKERVNDYRRDVFLVQAGRENDMGVVKQLEMQSDSFHDDPLTDEYLNAEIAMCRLIQRISYMLLDKVGFDPEFEI